MASTNSNPYPFAIIAAPRFSKGAFLAIQWTGVVLSLSFMIFRVYGRLRLFHRLFPDDCLVVAAWLFYVAFGIIFQTQINSMWIALNAGSNRQEQLSPGYIERVNFFLNSQIGTTVLSFTALWLVKFSFLLFFRKLGHHVRRQRILWWAVVGFTSASYVVCISLGAFKCSITADPNALVHCTSISMESKAGNPQLKVTTGLDIMTDALIIVVSTNILWKVQISTRKKLALAGICSLTALIMCISAIRISCASSDDRFDDASYTSLGGVEIAIAIIVSCLASFRALYTHKGRLNRAHFQDRTTRKPIFHRTKWHRVPLRGPEDTCAFINAHHEARILREESPRTFSEDTIIPPNSIHVRHDFAVLPEPMDLYRPVLRCAPWTAQIADDYTLW